MDSYNLDFLYYQMPHEYKYRLDGPDDPNYDAIISLRIEFKRYMKECSLQEYVKIIVRCFKDKYPNPITVCNGIVETSYANPWKEKKPYRSEVKTIVEDWKPADDDVFEDREYLDSLTLNFKDDQPVLKDWIEEGLSGKSFTTSVHDAVTIYEVSESPIIKIEVEEGKFMMHINKASYVRY